MGTLILGLKLKGEKTVKKTWLMMFSMFALALLLVACGGNDDTDTNTGTDDGGTTEQTDEGATDKDEGTDGADGDTDATSYDADAAESSYQQSCASCHGGDLEGISGPELTKIGASLSEDEILDAILNGRTGMPPGMLQGDEAENVAAWLADKK